MGALDGRPKPLGSRLSRAIALLALGMAIALAVGGCGSDESTGGETAAPAAPTSDSAYSLSADGETLIGPGKRRTPIEEGAVTGYVDNVIREGQAMNVSGWAAKEDLAKPAERVVGVINGVGVGDTQPSASRSDVAETLDAPGIEKSGYGFFIETAFLECSAPQGGLSVFGVADGKASVLPFVGNSMQALDDVC